MPFVYLHVVLFAGWMLFVESDPWPRLTLVVSLEAIVLSTFVMIGQNRQAEFQRAKADHDFATEADVQAVSDDLNVRVPDITAAVERIKANGGQILNGPMEVPGGDWIVNAMDPQGAAFALHARHAQ